jgi:dihydroorotate dehydrogenase
VLAVRAAEEKKAGVRRPVIVKIAPDIAEEDIVPIVGRLKAHAVEGIAVSNTTLSRAGVTDAKVNESGGLSGRPLFNRSTVMLARVYQATGGKIPLIGIGGIDSPEAALTKIEAGATLLQLYTGLIYEGPGLIGQIKSRLAEEARRAGPGGLANIRGRTSAQWASKPLT